MSQLARACRFTALVFVIRACFLTKAQPLKTTLDEIVSDDDVPQEAMLMDYENAMKSLAPTPVRQPDIYEAKMRSAFDCYVENRMEDIPLVSCQGIEEAPVRKEKKLGPDY